MIIAFSVSLSANSTRKPICFSIFKLAYITGKSSHILRSILQLKRTFLNLPEKSCHFTSIAFFTHEH